MPPKPPKSGPYPMPPARTPQDVLFQQILGEFREMNSEIAALRAEMETFKEALEPITRIVRGDGIVQSIGTQIELVKQSITHSNDQRDKTNAEQNAKIAALELSFRTTKESQDKKIKDAEDKVDSIHKEDRKGRLGIITVVITGIIGLITTIAGVIIGTNKSPSP